MKRGRTHWATDCPPVVLGRARAAIEAGETAADIHRRLHLRRYCSDSAFRRWAQRIRRQYEQRATVKAGSDSRDIETIEKALLTNLLNKACAGTLRASMLREVRLFLRELERREQGRNRSGNSKSA